MEQSEMLDQYQQKALEIYNELTGSFGGLMTSSNYWQAGNVFDTVTDFMLTALEQGLLTQTQIDPVIAAIKTKYSIADYSYNGGQGAWYDDFGWWGIASVKAYTEEYGTVFGNHKTDFQAIANSCYSIMNNGKPEIDKGAPNVWKNCNQIQFHTAEPYFEGGVWQYDINDQYNPLNPGTVLGPFQVSVVNGLYFVLSLRMAAAGQPANDAITNMHRFISSWCFFVGIKNGRSLLFRGKQDDGLVLERVPIYKNGTQVNPASWAEAYTSWCGDQGLMMGGMAEYLLSNPSDKKAADLVDLISNGVPAHMVSNQLIAPWYPIQYNHLQEKDPGDYSSGSGVFMRYLLYCLKNNASIKYKVNTDGSALRSLVLNSANACVNGTYPSYGNPLFDQFNRLAILTTAINVI